MISAYTIIATNEVHLQNDNIVQTGGVGVNGANNKIKVFNASNIIGFAKASQILINGGSTVGLPVYAPANIPLPTFIYNTVSNNQSLDVIVNNNQTQTLTESVYGKVEIKNGANVTFTQQNIYIDELVIRNDATVQFSSCSNLLINKRVQFGERTIFNSNENMVTMYVNNDVDIDKGSLIVARIYANNKDIDIKGDKNGSTTYMQGLFIGKKVIGNKNVVWNSDTYCAPCPVTAPPTTNQGRFGFDITAWPNPSDNEFNLKLTTSNETEIVQVYVFDVSNKMVHSGKFNPDQTYIFGKELQGGVYIVKVVQGKDAATTRLIKY